MKTSLQKRLLYSFYSILIMPVLFMLGVFLFVLGIILPILVLLFPDEVLKVSN